MKRGERRGFTLVELLAALSISGLAMLAGVMLLDQVTDGSSRIARAGRIAARHGNGSRLLRQLLLDAHVTGDSVDRFRGDERSVDVSTLCQQPDGWMEPCRASLGVDWRGDTSVVTASLATGERLELARYSARAELRYFDAIPSHSAWLQRWAVSIAMPVAIAFVSAGDTAIYPLGVAR
jgi:prepilin-type N-terminal cleavage/methylation domain-containing protein